MITLHSLEQHHSRLDDVSTSAATRRPSHPQMNRDMDARRKAAETPGSHYMFLFQYIMMTLLPNLLQNNIKLAFRVNGQGEKQVQSLRLICRGRHASIMQGTSDIHRYLSHRRANYKAGTFANHWAPSITIN